MSLVLASVADTIGAVTHAVLIVVVLFIPPLICYGGYLWMLSFDDPVRRERGKHIVATSVMIGAVVGLGQALSSLLSSEERPAFAWGVIAGITFIPLLLIGIVVWALLAVRREQEAEQEDEGEALPASKTTSPLSKQPPALAVPEPLPTSASEFFRLLDEQFEQVVQVRKRLYEEGALTLEEWQQRYDNLIQARRDVETEAWREEARRLDEMLAAGTITRGQYTLRIEERLQKTMRSLLKRADKLDARNRQGAARSGHAAVDGTGLQGRQRR